MPEFPSSAEEASAALRASKAMNESQQHLTDESRVLLAALLRDESRVLLADLMEQRMRTAVAEGIQAVLTSEEMWTKVFAVLQKQATERTGRFVLGGLKTVFRRLVWTVGFGLIAYGVGGWTFVKAVWAAMNRG